MRGGSTMPTVVLAVMGAEVSLNQKHLMSPGNGRMTWNPEPHIMGASIMGDSPADSVVNRWGRTHDVPNLWIIGSSVFPTSATSNPTLTIAALTLRTAHAIQRELNG